MILTKEQSEKRLSSEKNIINQTPSSVVQFKKIGVRNPDGNNGGDKTPLTDEERIAIGVVAHTTDNATAAEFFGIDKQYVSAIKYGNKTSSGQRYHDPALANSIKERLDSTRLSVEEKAAEVLLKSMGLIDEEKLENSSAKELAQITNQMSQVVRNMRGPTEKDNGQKGSVKVVIMQPKTSREDSFDVIEVGLG